MTWDIAFAEDKTPPMRGKASAMLWFWAGGTGGVRALAEDAT